MFFSKLQTIVNIKLVLWACTGIEPVFETTRIIPLDQQAWTLLNLPIQIEIK